MNTVRRALIAVAVTACAGAMPVQSVPSAAQAGGSEQAPASDGEIVVSVFSYNDIVVNGRVRRCQRRAGDPLDKVNIRIDVDPHTGMPRPEYLAMVPDGGGGYASVPDNEQITGPDFWQRVGVGMDRYVFRAPSSGKPMCVGGRRGSDEGDRFAGFRRIVDAAPYRGHRLRFTAQIATARAHQVSFWLAAGNEWREDGHRTLSGGAPRRVLLNGGNADHLRFGGNNEWTPVVFETGPIHSQADHVSYGFNLQGSGDVWVHEPKLEIVADQPERARTGDRIVIGRE